MLKNHVEDSAVEFARCNREVRLTTDLGACRQALWIRTQRSNRVAPNLPQTHGDGNARSQYVPTVATPLDAVDGYRPRTPTALHKSRSRPSSARRSCAADQQLGLSGQ